jgi:hypothetical protein
VQRREDSGQQAAGQRAAGQQAAGQHRAAQQRTVQQQTERSAGKDKAAPVEGSGTRIKTGGLPPGLDLDELVALVSRRLRAEFRVNREGVGKLRDSTR